MKEYVFAAPGPCLNKWEELKNAGISDTRMTLYAPHPVHGLDDQIDPKPSALRVFTLLGAILGGVSGFALCIYCTVYSWPLITGGKPLNSIAAYIVIAYELTILFGAIISFIGLMLLAKLPDIKGILNPKDYGNHFVIVVEDEE